MLIRCLYASRTTTPLGPDVLDAMLEQSRRNNPRLGITGLLCVSDNVFIQVLEGGRDAVNELLWTIARDPRHTNVRLLAYEEISERRFGQWTMGHVNLAKVNASLLLKYSTTATLDPFTGSARATMALLDELVASAAIISRP